ncbi:MAG TPA: hypothetical protein VL793_08440, partial [Patescibacteria group bacterium]|nr:hypothetical protein [Patescibacteria group bacterium]
MNRIRSLPYILLLAAASAQGGTFAPDFTSADTSSFTLNGAGTLSDQSAWMPFIATNRLILTVNQNNLNGSFSPYEFDSGNPILAFTASFQLQFGPGSGQPADGLALSFGPDINQYSTTYSEAGAGGTAFAVSFHTYTSSGGPAVDVYLHGQRIAHAPVALADMVNSQMQDVVIKLNQNSTLDISYRGQPVLTNLYLEGWGPSLSYFIFSGRTGGENEVIALANVRIDTTTYTTPVAPTVTAAPKNVTVNEGDAASFSVNFDGTGPFTIQWRKNGNPIQDAT